jgi:hypothetical protein
MVTHSTLHPETMYRCNEAVPSTPELMHSAPAGMSCVSARIPADWLQCLPSSPAAFDLFSTSSIDRRGDPTHVHGSSPVRTNSIWYRRHQLAVGPNLNR